MYDEPELDVAVVRGSDADYKHRIPTADDAGLLVEVSGSTLYQDRGKQGEAYARGRIPVYWIVNLIDRQVEVYFRPGKSGYKWRATITFPASQSRSQSAAAEELPRSPLMSFVPATASSRLHLSL